MIGLYLCRQRPTLPHTFACSTIGPAGLNFRVRDGNGCFPRGKITGNLRRFGGVRAASRNPERFSARDLSTPNFSKSEPQIPRRAKALLGMTSLQEPLDAGLKARSTTRP